MVSSSSVLGLVLISGILIASLIICGALAEDTKPHYEVGSGADDWWVTYPGQHSSSGSAVKHPQWVLDSLKEKPVLILDHSKDCRPCKEQISYVNAVLPAYDNGLTYYNMMADEGDPRTNDVFSAYNPTGGADYVPITVLVTLVRGPDGKVQVGWHSVDDSTSEEWLRSYISDAIYYYKENSADWN
ncbi:MAG TPA: thioredoxin family protein [Methanotrichaceae archaeon]|nr:thioredoxin family protein [Methanotrichaceae archaeon]